VVEDRIERALHALTLTVQDLQSRVAALEAGASQSVPGPAPGDHAAAAVDDHGVLPDDFVGQATLRGLPSALSLAGGTVLALGGAFLLRAITESGVVSATPGVLIGLFYAVVWVWLAARAAARGKSTAAEFHGVAAVLIAFPLLWEATTRFAVLGPVSSTVALSLVTLIGLGAAWLRRLPVTAWAFTLAATVVGVAFLFATGRMLLPASLLVGLGMASLWLAYTRGWAVLHWVVAAAANLAILRVTGTASRPEVIQAPDPVVAAPAAFGLALVFLLAYLGSFAVRTLARSRNVGLFEVVQSIAVIAVGLGGAAGVERAMGFGAAALGGAALAAGGLCYAVAFVFVRERQGRGRNFLFYTSLALALVVTGCRLTGSGALCTMIWSLLGAVAALLGGRFDRVTLRAHAAIYAVAATVSSGLLDLLATAWLGPVKHAWHVSPWAYPALALAVVSYATLVATRTFRTVPRLARMPRFLLALISLLGIGGLTVLLVVHALSGGAIDAGAIAATRTIVLSIAVGVLAWARRRARLPELGWIAALALAVTAVKLVVEDLRAGGATPLFLAFAFYGLALLTVPRLLWPAKSRDTEVPVSAAHVPPS